MKKHFAVRFKGQNYVRVVSCNAKKLRFFAPKVCAILFATLMCVACASTKESDEYADSWKVYCAKYNVDVDNPSVSQEDYYLDCYVGTIEEEADLGLNR